MEESRSASSGFVGLALGNEGGTPAPPPADCCIPTSRRKSRSRRPWTASSIRGNRLPASGQRSGHEDPVLVVIDAPDAPASEGPEGRRRLPARPWFALAGGKALSSGAPLLPAISPPRSARTRVHGREPRADPARSGRTDRRQCDRAWLPRPGDGTDRPDRAHSLLCFKTDRAVAGSRRVLTGG